MSDVVCANCKKASGEVPNMKFCAKCHTTPYCNRDCQKADWKVHKKICSQQAASHTGGRSTGATSQTNKAKNLDNHIAKPFTALEKGTWIHDRSEKDVYKLLIDAFRMRQADIYKFYSRRDPSSVYTGASSSIVPFREYLRLAAQIPGYLPDWWNAEKQKECEDFGESNENWSSLKRKASKEEIIKHYGDEEMPMQMRMFAEKIYGTPPAPGANSSSMIRMLSMREEGELPEGAHISRLSLS